MKNETETVGLNEAAKMLCCTPPTVLALVTTCLLPHAGTKRRPVLFRRKDVEALAEIFRANLRAAKRQHKLINRGKGAEFSPVYLLNGE